MVDRKEQSEIQPIDVVAEKPLLYKKGMIVEFVGPTGSGKTTNCNQFKSQLEQEHLVVGVFSDLKAYYYGLPFLKRTLIIVQTLISGFRKIISFSIVLLANGIYRPGSIYRYFTLSVFNRAMQEFMKESNIHILLLDQWVIQGLWSATIFREGTFEKLQRQMPQFYFKSDYVLFFDIDVETAAQRIASRDSSFSRFDRMNETERLLTLRKYNDYLIQLFEHSECRNKFKFSTLEAPEKNASIFVKLLRDHPLIS